MERRNGRRRRVLMDESRNEEDASLADEENGNAFGYSESALHQPSLTDMIPVRPLRVLTTMLGSITALVALLVLDDWSNNHEISSFQMGEPGSLASWFASTLLMWAAGGAALTYLIRRHRKDDYRGAYYVWVWTAGMLVCASVAATTPWHRELNAALARLTNIDLGRSGWWMSTIGAASLLMLLRIAVELRQCRLALMLILSALAGYVSVALVQTEVLMRDQPQLAELTCQFGLLASHLTLAYAVWWNARYVQLDARGVHAEKAAKRAETKAAREAKRNEKREGRLAAKKERNDGKDIKKAKRKKPAAKEQVQDQEDEAAPPRASTKAVKRNSQTARDDRDDHDDDGPDTVKMDSRKTKADRRRERKQKRNMAA